MRKRKTSSNQHRNCNITMDCVIIIDKHRHRQRTLNSAYSLYKYSCSGSWKRLPHTESTQSGINKISSHAGGSSSSLLSLQPEPYLGRSDTHPGITVGPVTCWQSTLPPTTSYPKGHTSSYSRTPWAGAGISIISLHSFTLLNIYSNLLADNMGTRDTRGDDFLYSTKFWLDF